MKKINFHKNINYIMIVELENQIEKFTKCVKDTKLAYCDRFTVS